MVDINKQVFAFCAVKKFNAEKPFTRCQVERANKFRSLGHSADYFNINIFRLVSDSPDLTVFIAQCHEQVRVRKQCFLQCCAEFFHIHPVIELIKIWYIIYSASGVKFAVNVYSHLRLSERIALAQLIGNWRFSGF